MHAFDRRTDRQTDRNLIVRPRLHSMQRGKNQKTVRTSIFDALHRWSIRFTRYVMFRLNV